MQEIDAQEAISPGVDYLPPFDDVDDYADDGEDGSPTSRAARM